MKAIMLLLTLLIIISGNSNAEVTSKSWNFDVYLDDDFIGEHSFTVRNQGENVHVEIFAAFTVKFLFFNAYEYRHNNKEIWQGQCLKSIESVTDDNGTPYRISGNKQEENFELTTNEKSSSLKGCIQSFFYWDLDILNQSKLLNSQTGAYEPIEVEKLERRQITIHNQKVLANQYRIKAEKFSVDLWYSDQGEWLSLRSTTSDGNVLNYKLKRGI